MRTGARLALFVVMLATVGCDRVTKHVAEVSLAGEPTRSFLADTFRLTYVENPGGFLSLGANLSPVARTVLFTLGTGFLLVLLVVAGLRARWPSWRALGLALLLGGGLSNWIDRLAYGRVVDFMNVGVGRLRTGIFNVADVALMIGIILVFLPELRREAASDSQRAEVGER